MSISIQPLFVFDGPHKPPFKRNKRSAHHGVSVPNLLCKQLLNLFGFPFHMAPGEAEAECALLQRKNIVDAVLSEDVDTLMFGSGLTLRNWSSEGRGNKSPTHVSAYYAKATKEGKSGLDREGMILIALMSGGDYITEGIPGCGIKAACEAARAGFGKSLCQLPRSDVAGLDAWRKNLTHEIQTNESKFFRVKHKSLTIPENFPSKEVLSYYTHPVVSSASKLQKLEDEIVWEGEVDIQGLRLFVAEAFDWTHKLGAKKFIRGLAPVLLAQKLRLRGDRRASGYDDALLTAMNEMQLVKAICGKRAHFSTDGVTELRVVYHPADIVGLDLDAEEDDSEECCRDGLAPTNEDDEIERYLSDPEAISRSASPSNRAPAVYDPTQPDRIWVFETIAKVGIPLKVEDYEESLRNPKKFLRAKAAAKRAAAKGGMPKGAMDKFVSMSKTGIDLRSRATKGPGKTRSRSSQPVLPPTYLAPVLEKPVQFPPTATSSVSTRSKRQKIPPTLSQATDESSAVSRTTKSRTIRTMAKPLASNKTTAGKPGTNTNPWTIAHSSSPHQAPSITKNIGQQFQKQTAVCSQQTRSANAEILLKSSPPPSVAPPATLIARKYTYSAQSESEPEEEIATNSSISWGDLAALQIRTPSSSEKDRDRPSPRKKLSPLAPLTITSQASPIHSARENLTPKPVNRKIDLSTVSRARFSTPDLPPLRDLASPAVVNKARSAELEYVTLSSSPNATQSPIMEDVCGATVEGKAVNRKKYILLRESLPGAWREADISELVQGRSRAWRYSQVECLDLSAE